RQVSFSGGFGLAVSHDDAERGAATNAWERYGSRGDGGEDGGEDGAAVLSDVVSRGDSVNVERKLDGVRVRFGGWRDVAMSRRRDDRTGESDSGTAAVRYRSNGTVRPHRWIVENADDPEDRIEITVNAVGRATVEAAKR
ncbi:MAG: hypothetical protein IJ678_01225, partial [Kiritimatiellae bacterium]|nr:hypothetical protein [Kiritimatiellia bacterium]